MQKVIGNETGQVLADFIFAVRNDRRVRNRYTHWVPEQRHHGKPVGECPHHAGLGKRVHPASPALRSLQGQEKERRHQGQQKQWNTFHAQNSIQSVCQLTNTCEIQYLGNIPRKGD